MSNSTLHFQREYGDSSSTVFAYRIYINSIYSKGSRDEDNNDKNIELNVK